MFHAIVHHFRTVAGKSHICDENAAEFLTGDILDKRIDIFDEILHIFDISRGNPHLFEGFPVFLRPRSGIQKLIEIKTKLLHQLIEEL